MHLFENRAIFPFWRRIVAFLIDVLLLSFVLFVAQLFFEMTFPDQVLLSWYYASDIGAWLLMVLYFAIFDSSIGKGQTLGKRFFRIAVRQRDNSSLSFRRGLIRTLLLAVVILPFPYFIAVGNILFNTVSSLIIKVVLALSLYFFVFLSTRQTLGDLLVGSYVIRMHDHHENVAKAKLRWYHCVALSLILFYLLWWTLGHDVYELYGNGIPPELRAASVLQNNEDITKQHSYSNRNVGAITDIVVDSTGVVVVAPNAAAFLDKTFKEEQIVILGKEHFLLGKLKNRFLYSVPFEMKLVKDTGRYWFYTPEGMESPFPFVWYISPVQVFDEEGYRLWSYTEKNAFFQMQTIAAGKIDKNAEVIFVVSSAGIDSTLKDIFFLGRMNASGDILWQTEKDFYGSDPAIIQTDADTTQAAIMIKSSGDLILLDCATGKETKRIPAPGDDISLLKTVAGTFPIGVNGGNLSMINWNGEVLKTLSVNGLSPDYDQFSSVQWGDRIAVLFSYRLFARSVLYIFDTSNAPVYHEIIADDCVGMTTMKKPDGKETLLLGCSGTLWEYR